MKIYFLLALISGFVALSYVPIRAETKQKARDTARFRAGLMPKA